MKSQRILLTPFVSILFCCLFFSIQNISAQDTCLVNDDCLTAIDLGIPSTDHTQVNRWGCNLYSSPDTLIEGCLMGDYPTVWYRFTTDLNAEVLTAIVRSEDFEMPVLALFKSESGTCDNLEQVLLTSSNLSCVIGSNGLAKVIGTPVETNTTYYLAVSSYLSIGGDFWLHLRTLSEGFVCVVNKAIEIRSRENDGPLEGPFDSNEKVSFCFKVNEYTASNNGCQWFQGLVPVFGNGWDPSSFDNTGQPINATVNGYPIPEANNGVYGVSQWGWFDDVDYHHFSEDLSIGDFDNNGRLDMCNSRYDPDCPYLGVNGGCCNPCWGSPSGDTLPAGWFAYGINGSCPDPGPPIRVDWGDGNTCGGPMGPWEFCFDLVTKDMPDCDLDTTTRDLSVGFFTFADGETGAWTGSASVCAKDAPLKLSLEAKCGRIRGKETEILPALEHGDTLNYVISEPDIVHWEWNISPYWAVPYVQNAAQNGFTISAPLVNTFGETIDVTGIFIGYYEPNFSATNDRFVKKIKFKLNDGLTNAEEVEAVTHHDAFSLKVYPMPVVNSAMLEWAFDLRDNAAVFVFDAQGRRIAEKTVFPGDGRRTQIDTDGWSSGVYYIRFGNGEFQSFAKMFKI